MNSENFYDNLKYCKSEQEIIIKKFKNCIGQSNIGIFKTKFLNKIIEQIIDIKNNNNFINYFHQHNDTKYEIENKLNSYEKKMNKFIKLIREKRNENSEIYNICLSYNFNKTIEFCKIKNQLEKLYDINNSINYVEIIKNFDSLEKFNKLISSWNYGYCSNYQTNNLIEIIKNILDDYDDDVLLKYRELKSAVLLCGRINYKNKNLVDTELCINKYQDDEIICYHFLTIYCFQVLNMIRIEYDISMSRFDNIKEIYENIVDEFLKIKNKQNTSSYENISKQLVNDIEIFCNTTQAEKIINKCELTHQSYNFFYNINRELDIFRKEVYNFNVSKDLCDFSLNNTNDNLNQKIDLLYFDKSNDNKNDKFNDVFYKLKLLEENHEKTDNCNCNAFKIKSNNCNCTKNNDVKFILQEEKKLFEDKIGKKMDELIDEVKYTMEKHNYKKYKTNDHDNYDVEENDSSSWSIDGYKLSGQLLLMTLGIIPVLYEKGYFDNFLNSYADDHENKTRMLISEDEDEFSDFDDSNTTLISNLNPFQKINKNLTNFMKITDQDEDEYDECTD